MLRLCRIRRRPFLWCGGYHEPTREGTWWWVSGGHSVYHTPVGSAHCTLRGPNLLPLKWLYRHWPGRTHSKLSRNRVTTGRWSYGHSNVGEAFCRRLTAQEDSSFRGDHYTWMWEAMCCASAILWTGGTSSPGPVDTWYYDKISVLLKMGISWF